MNPIKNLHTLGLALIILDFAVCHVLDSSMPYKRATPPQPAHADVPYDCHERTKLDFWQAEGHVLPLPQPNNETQKSEFVGLLLNPL